MHINEILKFCEDNGRKMSKQAIYQAGIRHGFIHKVEGKSALEFDEDKFKDWFLKSLEKAPEGWVRMSELIKMYNLNLVFAYKLLKDKDCVHRKYGSGVGVTYVKLDGIEGIIAKNRIKKNNERSE